MEEDNLEDSQDEEEDVLLNIKTAQTTRKGQILVGLHVGDCPLTIELDTGATVSVVSQKTWQNRFSDHALDPCTKHLQIYSGEPIPVLGQRTVCVHYRQQKRQLPMTPMTIEPPYEGYGSGISACMEPAIVLN